MTSARLHTAGRALPAPRSDLSGRGTGVGGILRRFPGAGSHPCALSPWGVQAPEGRWLAGWLDTAVGEPRAEVRARRVTVGILARGRKSWEGPRPPRKKAQNDKGVLDSSVPKMHLGMTPACVQR